MCTGVYDTLQSGKLGMGEKCCYAFSMVRKNIDSTIIRCQVGITSSLYKRTARCYFSSLQISSESWKLSRGKLWPGFAPALEVQWVLAAQGTDNDRITFSILNPTSKWWGHKMGDGLWGTGRWKGSWGWCPENSDFLKSQEIGSFQEEKTEDSVKVITLQEKVGFSLVQGCNWPKSNMLLVTCYIKAATRVNHWCNIRSSPVYLVLFLSNQDSTERSNIKKRVSPVHPR